jgi:DNA polymerase III subunit beta
METLHVMSKDFIGAAQAVKAACNAKGSLPILTHACVRTGEREAIIHTTNLDFSLFYRFPVSGDPLEFTFPLKPFLATAPKLFSDERLDITVDPKTLKVTFAQGPHQYTLQGFLPMEFPLPPSEFVLWGEFDAEELTHKLKFVLPASDKRETRPILTGIFFRSDGSTLDLVAADGYRLHKEVCVKGRFRPGEYVIPATVLQDVLKILPDDAPLYISHAETTPATVNLQLECGPLSAVCHPLEGKFPDYELIIPRSCSATVTCQAADLLAGFQAVSALAFSNGDDAVKLHAFTPEDFTLFVSTVDGEITTCVTATGAPMPSADFAIWLNVSYLIAATKGLEQLAKAYSIPTRVQLEFNNVSSPVVLRLENTPALCVVMPMNKE